MNSHLNDVHHHEANPLLLFFFGNAHKSHMEIALSNFVLCGSMWKNVTRF